MKNESDIVEQALRAAANWSDAIYVLDNGSSDGTWEIVQGVARELPAVIPYKQDPRPFDDGIRDNLLQAYRPRARPGDWWCILDADEFYIDNPREFLSNVPARYNSVFAQLYNFVFTERDLIAYRNDPALYGSHVPIEQRLRYFTINDYSPIRFVRHSRTLRSLPYEGLHPVYPRLIRFRHYMYRSPEQIRKRFETRREPMLRGEWLHERRSAWTLGAETSLRPSPAQADELPEDWTERLIPSSKCCFDTGTGEFPEGPHWVPPRPPNNITRIKDRVRSSLGHLAHSLGPTLGTGST
ncbi:hypothetical protein Rumeso_02627 [Rubellimicrobium mesophilum DSM 19309]|uniref:Uncharacterized protein n=1 Tax=Rubellimicrobium mesophilum DSM 19309 TaxID=442562 RepID=A0A017HNE9_9RHOB|nr:hypothetical protein Rumeso_02627 [Rubellimicrobium mesophilum DSM 19309]